MLAGSTKHSAEISTSVLGFPRTGKKSTIFSHSELRQYFSIRSFLTQRYIPRLDEKEDCGVKKCFWDAHGRIKDDSEVPLDRARGGQVFLPSEKKSKFMRKKQNIIFSNIVTKRSQDDPVTFTNPGVHLYAMFGAVRSQEHPRSVL